MVSCKAYIILSKTNIIYTKNVLFHFIINVHCLNDIQFIYFVGLTTQTDDSQEQTNIYPENVSMPTTDASPEISGIAGVMLNSQEIKFHVEAPIFEDSLGSQERNKYVINNRSFAGLEELEGNINGP
jgi:hypothetical protein